MYSDSFASARRRATSATRPLAALVAFSLCCSIVPTTPVEASAGTHLQRIKGTVGYSSDAGATHHEVVTSADVADGSSTYAKCSSLAALSFSSGATAMLGGSTDLKAPTDGSPAMLSDGIVQYRTDSPFAIATKYGTVSIKRGTGYVLAGRDGVEIISVDAGSNDVVYATAAGSFAVPGGKSLAQPITSGKPGTALLLANSAVNNPATYQFAQGRNPLGTDSVKPFDPTGSPTTDCKFATAASAAEIGAIIAALLGAGAVAAGSQGGGTSGNISPSSPTPFPSGNISPSSPTPFPTSSASGSPSSSPSGSPSGSPSSSPSGSPSSSPSGSPSTSPSGSPSSSPSGSPSTSPSSSPSASPTGSASPTPVGTLGAVVLNPNAILLNPGLGQSATATVSVTQSGYTGAYTASLSACTGVGAHPKVTVVSTGPGTANVVLTSTGALNLNLGCTLKVTGGGGDTASAAVAITLVVLPTPAPSPSASPNPSASPTATPTLGPVSLNPNSVLLNPGLGTSASATVAASQPGYAGTFTAAVSGCVGVGTKPKATVTSTGAGTANVTLTATGALNLNLACTVKVTGGGGDSASAPVAVSLSIAGPTPTPAPSTSPSASPSGTPHGPLVLNPSSVLLDPGIGAPATVTVAASESGYTGTYTASVTGCVGVGTPPKATVVATGPGTANVSVTSTGTVNLNLGCTLDVKGGGESASAPVTISVSALSTPTPTPVPTSSGAIGALTVTPNAVLINPGLGSAATTKLAVTQPNFPGPFTATVGGCVGVGSQPVAAVTNTATGKATVTVTASGVINANLACNVTIAGGNGATATVPVTITLAALPSPTPSPTGTGLGAITANPSAVLLLPGLGSNASTNVVVSQANYTGTFGATLSCPVGLGGQPDVTVSSNGTAGQGVITVTVPGALSAAVACNVYVTGGGGKKLTIPVTVGAAIGGGATPTPAPGGTGPLTANPASILLNPGITTSATQNVALSDPGYTGAYAASIACATSGLSPILQGLFVTPTVNVSGGNLTVTSPGQVLGIALGCNVTVTTTVPQSLTVPITLSVTAVNGLARRSAASTTTASSMVFSPASVALQPHGARATGSFDVAGVAGPLSTSVACPAGATVRTTTLGDRVELEQLAAAVPATCMVTVTSKSGISSQVPVRTYATAGITSTAPAAGGSRRLTLGRPSLALRVGETQTVSVAGSGSVEFSGCDGVATIRTAGAMLLATGRAPGRCNLVVRGPGGTSATLPVTVGALAAPVAPGRGAFAP